MTKNPTLQTVELHFHVRARTLPTLHAYALYSAISRTVPALHKAPWLGIHTLRGRTDGDRVLRLPPRPKLRLRLPQEQILSALPLSGQTINVKGHPMHIGVPLVRPLIPAASLSARMVTIKNFTASAPFQDAVRRQLETLNVNASVEVGARLVQPIGQKMIVGFAVWLHQLSAEDALTIQTEGIGGRRRMGCGLFLPSKGRPPQAIEVADD